MKKYLLGGCVALVALLPAIFLLSIILRNSVNVPYFDDYNMVPVYQQIDHHEVPVHSLLELDNENREVFPKIMIGTTAYLTHWNIRTQTVVNYALAVAILGLLCVLIKATVRNTILKILSVLFTSYWLFSPVEAENWLWAWEAVWYICIGAALLSLYCLYRLQARGKTAPPLYLFGVAVASGVIATFSLASGLLVWPVGLTMLLLQKQKKHFSIAWLAAAVLSSAIYFYHYAKPARSPSPFDLLHEPVNFAKFFLTLLGRPISDQMHGAMTFGGILLLLLVPLGYAVWLQQRRLQKVLPWLAILVFSLLALFLTATGRVGGGLGNSLSSRYTVLSILYIISLGGAFVAVCDGYKLKATALWGLVLLVAAVSIPTMIASYSNGLEASGLRHKQMLAVKACTSKQNPTNDCLVSANFHLDTSISSSQLQYLKQKHFGGY